MITVQIEVDGTTYEGHGAITSDGSLRVISRHGSQNIALGNVPLPLEIQTEMTLAEIVSQLHAAPGTSNDSVDGLPEEDRPSADTVADHQTRTRETAPSRPWTWPALPWAAQGQI